MVKEWVAPNYGYQQLNIVISEFIMNKKFFVSVILAVLSVNVSLFCNPLAEEVWKNGDDVYLRSVINIIDIEIFGGELSKYVRAVN